MSHAVAPPRGAALRAGTGGRERVPPSDAMWLQDSPTNLMIINAVYTTDRIDLETVREVFQAKVIDLDGGRRWPRFTKRVLWARGRPYWEEDADFDVRRHVFAAPDQSLHDTDTLQRYISSIADRPLPPERPLWQVQYIEEFEDGGSAFVVRIHHAMADGIALVPIIFALMDELSPEWQDRHYRGMVASAIQRVVLAPLASPFVLARRLLWRRDRHPLHGPRISGQKRVAWTRPFPLDAVKRVKNAFGATVNDVLMACVSGAFARVLRTAGAAVDAIRVSMPVNMRGPHEPIRMENRFAAVLLNLPVGIADARLRVQAIKRRMDDMKRSVEPLVIYGVQVALLAGLPNAVSRRLIDFLANKCTSVVTNVPGPEHELTIAGRRLRTLMYWVPQRAEIGIGISILTFAGRVQLGVIADTALVSDPAVLVGAIEDEFEALRRLHDV